MHGTVMAGVQRDHCMRGEVAMVDREGGIMVVDPVRGEVSRLTVCEDCEGTARCAHDGCGGPCGVCTEGRVSTMIAEGGVEVAEDE